eukprot:gene16826-17007_t
MPRDPDGIICINSRVGKFYSRPSDSDMSVFRQIFVERSYDFNRFAQKSRIFGYYQAILAAGKTPIIVDAGANIGASSMYLAKFFPEALVFAVEPDPQNIKICRLNCAPYQNIRVKEAAIGAVPGKVSIEKSKDDSMSWAIKTDRNSDGETQILTVRDIVSECPASAPLAQIRHFS